MGYVNYKTKVHLSVGLYDQSWFAHHAWREPFGEKHRTICGEVCGVQKATNNVERVTCRSCRDIIK